MILCAVMPHFAASLLRPPLGAPSPLVVVRHFKRTGKVIALSPDAERAGVTRGMVVSRARAVYPKARFVSADDPAFADASETLHDRLWTFTNRVEVEAESYPHHAVCYADLGNLREGDAALLGEEAGRSLRAAFGVGVQVGIARGRLTAALAAWSADAEGVVWVGRDDERVFIAPFPVERLPLVKDEARRLALLGLRTIGDLAALPRHAVTAAFGKHGTLLHRLACGLDGRGVVPARMPQHETIRANFEPLDSRERLDYTLCRLTDGLADALERRGMAAHRVVVTLHAERGRSQSETLRLLDPAGSEKALREAAARLLARMAFDRAIVGLEISAAHLVPAVMRQLELFAERPVSRGVIDLTRTLAARFGTTDFYTAASGQPGSLIVERRYALRRVALDGEDGVVTSGEAAVKRHVS